MMKIHPQLRASYGGLLFICIALLISSQIFAQSECSASFAWAQQAGGTSIDYGYSIAIDEDGNSYITGNFRGTSTFGGTTLTSTTTSQYEVYVAKLDKNGNFLWARSAGGESNDYGREIVVDKQGNSYITGYFSGSATFGSHVINSNGNDDIFIAKLDKDGDFLWALNAGGDSRDEGWGLALDANANIYVTGRFIGTSSFGNITISSSGSGNFDVFVAKLDNNGNFLWAKKAGGISEDEGHGIAVDKNGNSYVTGSFSAEATFGSTALTSSGASDVFVSKLDKDGNFVWTVRGGGTTIDYSSAIAVDDHGNSYITGYYDGTSTFGGTSLTSLGNNDIFIAKVNNSGDFEWARSAGSATANDYGRSIAVDGAGNSFVIGEYTGTISIGDFSLSSAGSGSDIFITRLDADGNYSWAIKAGGLVADNGRSVATDGNGNTYIAGYFSGTAFFGNNVILTSPSGNGNDIFVVKITDDCPNIPTPIVLLDFRAIQKGAAIDLNWATASESNNLGFDVEHSRDGVAWQSIGFVNSLAPDGNSNVRLDYFFEDMHPSPGLHYYRLLQKDMDGHTSYSDIRTVSIEQKVDIVAAPNPTKDIVTLRGLAGTEVIGVYSLDGKLLESIRALGTVQRISLGRYISGIYLLKISNGRNNITTLKVVRY